MTVCGFMTRRVAEAGRPRARRAVRRDHVCRPEHPWAGRGQDPNRNARHETAVTEQLYVHPARRYPAVTVFLSSIAIVNGPTPPGTGDSAPATSPTSGCTSPTT